MLPDMRNSPSCTCAVPGSEPAPKCNRYKGTLDVFYKVVRQVGGYKDFMNKLHIYLIKRTEVFQKCIVYAVEKSFPWTIFILKSFILDLCKAIVSPKKKEILESSCYSSQENYEEEKLNSIGITC